MPSTTLAFISEDASLQLARISNDGPEPPETRLSMEREGLLFMWPTWSPDGRTIVIQRQLAPTREIHGSSCGARRSMRKSRRRSTPIQPTRGRSSRPGWRTTSTGRLPGGCWPSWATWATGWPPAWSRPAAASSRAGSLTARRSISPGRPTDGRFWCIAARSCSYLISPLTRASGRSCGRGPASARRSGRRMGRASSTQRRARAAAARSRAAGAARSSATSCLEIGGDAAPGASATAFVRAPQRDRLAILPLSEGDSDSLGILSYDLDTARAADDQRPAGQRRVLVADGRRPVRFPSRCRARR